MAFKVGNYDPNAAKRAAIEAAKARAAGTRAEDAKLIKYCPPGECADRIRIEFDDSGSMSGQIENAKRGVVEFLKNCIPNQTAVAVHYMNSTACSTLLRSDLPQLAEDVKEAYLRSGGTPFFNTMKKMLEATPRATRLVVFTDGASTDQLEAEEGTELQSIWGTEGWRSSADVIIKITKSQTPAIPIDCVYFGPDIEYTQHQIKLLKYLAESTGGFFMIFDPAKMDFARGFKYLAPINRLRLTDGSFRAALERGEVK